MPHIINKAVKAYGVTYTVSYWYVRVVWYHVCAEGTCTARQVEKYERGPL
jgi:hypothetical protein